MSKIFKLIRPKSETDSAYEDFEYVIRWIGKDGADYTYLFMDAAFERRITNSVINEDISTRIEALITKESQKITLKADDLSRSDLAVMLQMGSNKFVTRLKKDGTTERFAPDGTTYKWRLLDGRYEIEFELIGSDFAKWN